jgi:hypothetical protein
MPTEPNQKRVIAFIDGQNLFHAAKSAVTLADGSSHMLLTKQEKGIDGPRFRT